MPAQSGGVGTMMSILADWLLEKLPVQVQWDQHGVTMIIIITAFLLATVVRAIVYRARSKHAIEDQVHATCQDAQDVAPGLKTAPFPGLFEQVPDTWMYELINSLPDKSRNALFACSRYLAERVLGVSKGVTLRLCSSQRPASWQVPVRRAIITKLLGVRREFSVQLQSAAWKPFPTQLADRVTSLSTCMPHEDAGEDGLVSACCQWAALKNLRDVCLQTRADIAGLCAAVEAGYLQHVRTLDIRWCYQKLNLKYLLRTLGPQLEELHTRSRPLAMEAHHLTALQRLTLYQCPLKENIMQQLCEHSCCVTTLRHVTLQQCEVVEDYSQCICNWDSLTLVEARLGDLLRLPLAGVRQICLEGGCGLYDTELQTDLWELISGHIHKFVCKPKNNTLSFAAGLPLLDGRQRVCDGQAVLCLLATCRCAYQQQNGSGQ